MSTKKTTYEYGIGNTFTRKDGTVAKVTKLPPNIPEPGDILFYKKRDWKKKRLNEMNQWRFVCIETQGQEKGKWKVQGLHKEVGDFNWFEPHYLMRSNEVTNDLVTKTQYPVKEDTKVKQNKKPISVTKPEGDTRKKVRELLDEGMRQSDIAKKLGLTQATISQHAKRIKNETPLPGEYPIFTYREANDYLDIDLKTLVSIAEAHSITPVLTKNGLMFTESQIEKLSELIKKSEKKEEEVTSEELGSYGADYQEVPKVAHPNLPIHVAAEKLGINETRLNEYIDSLNIKTHSQMNPSLQSIEWWHTISDGDLKRVRKAIDRDNQSIPHKDHKATIELKNYNYKRVIQENLSMIKSLIHQTNELLEKIK